MLELPGGSGQSTGIWKSHDQFITPWGSPVLRIRQTHEPRHDRRIGETTRNHENASLEPHGTRHHASHAKQLAHRGVIPSQSPPGKWSNMAKRGYSGDGSSPRRVGASTHVNAAARQNTDRDGSKSLGFLLRSGLYNLQQAHAHAPFPASCALLLGPD
jgi:hypothetical protein